MKMRRAIRFMSNRATPKTGLAGVLLVGNYGPDRQESMARFTRMLEAGLRARGVPVEVVAPRVRLGALAGPYRGAGIPKWLGYVDKYLLFPRSLRAGLKPGWVAHVTDHSNAVYVKALRGAPNVVTCHDLLAVRGALGEVPDCPATRMGVRLQKWILRGLGRAGHIACVTRATEADVRRLLPARGEGGVSVVSLGQNHPYAPPGEAEIRRRFEAAGLAETGAYVLHVGSNLARKNKAAVLHAVAKAGPGFAGRIVFAGPPLDDEVRRRADELGLAARVVEVAGPDNALLEALYAGARALVFPSRWEGFGWPVIEAQACGCPVITADRSSLPEVAGGDIDAGGAALLCPPDDHGALARALVRLETEPGLRERVARAGAANAAIYSTAKMIDGYMAIYGRLAGARL
jgi:glycosyltransferase involved in cell wall biosynthesis